MLSFWTFVVSQRAGPRLVHRAARHRRRGLDHLPAALDQRRHARARARRWWSRAIFVTGVATIMGGINYVTTVIRFRAPGHDLHADAADRLGPVAHRDPQRALRAGARLGRAAAARSTASFGTQFFIAGAAAVAAAATRSCSSTCSGSSATQRSTS